MGRIQAPDSAVPITANEIPPDSARALLRDERITKPLSQKTGIDTT